MPDKTIKAILFDLGNVIVRFDPEKLEEGYSACSNFKKGAIVDYLMDSQNINRYMEGNLTSSQFYSKTRKLFKMDIKFYDFYHIWNSIFYPYPEMEALVKAIKENRPDIKLVLLSNTNEAHYDFLSEEYKILEIFDACVVSHEVGRQKPHPDIYKEGLRAAGSIPKETFYTDDRPELIDAARIMGIRAFQFSDHTALQKQLAKYGIPVPRNYSL